MRLSDLYVGQRVRLNKAWSKAIGPPACKGLDGAEGTIKELRNQGAVLTDADRDLDFLTGLNIHHEWLEPVESASPSLRVTVETTYEAPRRPYDFSAGDQRKGNREEAIALAVERTYLRNCRQQVRASTAPDLIEGGTFWLVQDI